MRPHCKREDEEIGLAGLFRLLICIFPALGKPLLVILEEMEITTIRVNGGSLPNFVDRRVRVVGRVMEATDTLVTLNAADSQPIQVRNPRNHYLQGSTVEVVGKALNGHQIEEEASYKLNDDFGMHKWLLFCGY